MTIEPYDVRELIFRMTEPARRHRCPKCEQIFECHICAIGRPHPLQHDDAHPFVCLECAKKAAIDTISVNDTNLGLIKVYDYETGAIIDAFKNWPRGCDSQGRMGSG